uniref:Uncharacterized protein n=1 Tax=Plectus sambesii TaxID=2011161 RepID=A0A914WSQ6_9BILA
MFTAAASAAMPPSVVADIAERRSAVPGKKPGRTRTTRLPGVAAISGSAAMNKWRGRSAAHPLCKIEAAVLEQMLARLLDDVRE